MSSVEQGRKAGADAIENGVLVPATQTPPVIVPSISRPYPSQPNSFLRSPLPAISVQQPDTQRQWHLQPIPQSRISPLPVAASATINATAVSQTVAALKTLGISSGSGSGSGSVTSVGLSMPGQYAVTGSPVTSAGILAVTWNPVSSGQFLGGPVSGLSGYQDLGQNVGYNASSVVPAVSGSSSTASWFGFVSISCNNSVTTPAGWTVASSSQQWYQAGSGSGAINFTGAAPYFGGIFAALMIVFAGPAPSFVQQKGGSGLSSNFTYTSNPTAGDPLIVAATSYSNVTSAIAGFATPTTNQGDVFILLGSVSETNVSVGGVATAIWICPSCVGGSTTVSWSFSNPSIFIPTVIVQGFEFSPFSAGSGQPFFQPLNSSSFPPINLQSNGNGGVVGVLKVANGGTGASLLGTGGANLFVAQTSAGVPLSLVQPDFSNLLGAAGAFATSYNGVSLVSNGLPSEVATVDLTAQNSSLGPTTLKSAPQAGMYRIAYTAKVTTAATASSTLGGTTGFQIVYTDANDSVVVTTPAWWGGGNNGAAPTSAALNTTQTVISGEIIVNAKSGTNIQYQIGYTSSGGTAMLYNLHIKLESL